MNVQTQAPPESRVHERRLYVVVPLNATTQLPDACGYLGASWACRARILGNDFDQMTIDHAETYNDPDQIWGQNEILEPCLELYASQRNAEWLTGDQILRLVSLENPDHNHPDEMPVPQHLGAHRWLPHIHSPMARGRRFCHRVSTDFVLATVVATVSLSALLRRGGSMRGPCGSAEPLAKQ